MTVLLIPLNSMIDGTKMNVCSLENTQRLSSAHGYVVGISVTAPFRAKTLPDTVAPAVSVMLVSARIFPLRASVPVN
jgi:hypothetical protein